MKKLMILTIVMGMFVVASASATTNWNNPTTSEIFQTNGSNGNGNSENSKGNQGGGNHGKGLGNQPSIPSVPLPAAIWMFGTVMMGYLFSIRRKG